MFDGGGSDALLSAEEARHMWRTSTVVPREELGAALALVNRYIEYDAARGECDSIVKEWRRVVPDAVTRNLVLRELESQGYTLTKSGSRLIIQWRTPVEYASDDDE